MATLNNNTLTHSSSSIVIDLVKRPANEKPLSSTNCDGDYYSSNDDNNHVWILSNGSLLLRTKKDAYNLFKHQTLNMWSNECNRVKVQITLKKMGGKLRYWVKKKK